MTNCRMKKVERISKDFSRATSPAMACDNRGMAATVAEGTARKLLSRKCGRTMTKSEDRGDSSEERRQITHN
jgi:hypothetical protein